MTRRTLLPLAVGVAAIAAGFVRTSDGDTNVCLAWPERTVRWTVNPGRPATSPSCDGDGALRAVRAAFAAWPGATAPGAAAPCTDLRLVEDGPSTSTRMGFSRNGDNENLVVFRQGWCSDRVRDDDPCWDDGACGDAFGCFPDGAGDRHVIAVTTVTYESATGAILDADIEVADWDGQGGDLLTPPSNGWYFTCNDDVPQCASYGEDACAFIDLQNTLTHEVGHFVGLAHVPRTRENRSVTMYPDTSPLDVSKRDLSPDDVAGVCAIYPAGEETPSCGRRRDGGCGGQTAGEAGAGGAAGLGLALVALALRRARRPRQETTTPA